MPYKDPKKMAQYMREYRFVAKVKALLDGFLQPVVDAKREELYKVFDEQHEAAVQALEAEGRRLIHEEGCDPTTVITEVVKRVHQLGQQRKAKQWLVQQDIDTELQKWPEARDQIFEELVAQDPLLQKALEGDKDSQEVFLAKMKMRSGMKIDMAEPEVSPEIRKQAEREFVKAHSRVPSARELFEKMTLTEADRELLEMRQGHEVTKMADKYADMSDSEIRKAKQREEAEAFRKHREQLLAMLKRDGETPYTNLARLNAVKVDLIEELMTKRNLTYKEAEEAADATITEELGPPGFRECVRQKLKESPELTVEEAKDQCEASMVAKNLSQKLPSAEKLFAEAQKKKGTHWLDDEKGNAVEDTYVS